MCKPNHQKIKTKTESDCTEVCITCTWTGLTSRPLPRFYLISRSPQLQDSGGLGTRGL